MAKHNAEFIESFAAEIGGVVYLDVAKWHLYLKDAKLHTALAEPLYRLLEEKRLSADAVQAVLKDFPIKIGGGRNEISLADLVPLQCQRDLMDLLEEQQRMM